MSIFRNRLPYTQKNFLRDPNLLPTNIKKDVNVLGVIGTLEASPVLDSETNFSDTGLFRLYYRKYGKTYFIKAANISG
jgi:hypothetical protein